jgi:GT2 family glycosyltransferase
MNNALAVLITCYNRREETINCLRTLYRCNLPDYLTMDIFLVDDGSSDGTSDAIKVEFPLVRVIQGNGQLFWNRGMILAWTNASKIKKYDFYLWLNDDTILTPLAIKILFEGSEKYNKQSILIGTTTAKNSNKVTYGGYLLKNNKQVIFPNGNFANCDFFNGNIVLIPEFVFSKVGFLDPIYNHAFGDFDYGLRAKDLGIISYIAPEILGQCDDHETVPKWLSSDLSFKKRFKYFKLPTGPVPKECFIFENRHLGFWVALFHYITNYLRFFLKIRR